MGVRTPGERRGAAAREPSGRSAALGRRRCRRWSCSSLAPRPTAGRSAPATRGRPSAWRPAWCRRATSTSTSTRRSRRRSRARSARTASRSIPSLSAVLAAPVFARRARRRSPSTRRAPPWPGKSRPRSSPARPRPSCSWPCGRRRPQRRGAAARRSCSRSAPACGRRARRSGSTRRPCSFLCAGAALPGARRGRPAWAGRAGLPLGAGGGRAPRRRRAGGRARRSAIAVRWPRRIARCSCSGRAARGVLVLAYQLGLLRLALAPRLLRQRSRFSEPWGVGHSACWSRRPRACSSSRRSRSSRWSGSCARSAAASAGWPATPAAAAALAHWLLHGPLERMARRRELGPAA